MAGLDHQPRNDLTRIVPTVLFIGGLLASSSGSCGPSWALVWAIMIVVATWPMMLWVQQRVGGRRWLAVTIMSVLLLLVLIAPLSAAVTMLFQHADDIATWARNLKDFHLPPPPVAGASLAGERLLQPGRTWPRAASRPSWCW